MKKYECKDKHPNPAIKRAFLTRPARLSGARLAAWNRLVARLKYQEAKK